MYINTELTTSMEELLAHLDLSTAEAGHLLLDARTRPDSTQLTVAELSRLDQAVSRRAGVLAGPDWRRADAADRGPENVNQIGLYDLFHKRTGEHRRFATFGDLQRWSEAEYGWR